MTKHEENRQAVFDHLSANPTLAFSKTELVIALGMNPHTVKNILKELAKWKSVQVKEIGKQKYYRIRSDAILPPRIVWKDAHKVDSVLTSIFKPLHR